MKFHRHIGNDGGQFFAHDGQLFSCNNFSPSLPLILAAFCSTFSRLHILLIIWRQSSLPHRVYREYYPPHHPSFLKYQLPAPLFLYPIWRILLLGLKFRRRCPGKAVCKFNIFTNQLAIIFIGCNHINFVAFFFGLFGQCTNYIIGFIPVNPNYRNIKSFNYFF